MGASGSDVPQAAVSIHNLSMPLQPVFTSPPQNFITHGQGISDGNMPQTTVSVHNLSMPLEPVVFTSPHQWGGAEQQSNRYSHVNTYTTLLYNVLP